MSSTTIISALYNINREIMDGRSWQNYLTWFSNTLKLKCPMVLFVSTELNEFIKYHRNDLPTFIINNQLDELPYYYLKPNIDKIISSTDFQNKIADPNRIECKHSLYSIIQYSKFLWMQKASELNPFNSRFFFWLDAGGSRFFDNFNLANDWPGQSALKSFDSINDRFLLQMNLTPYQDLAFTPSLPDSYLLDNRSYILGSLFGSTQLGINKISELVDYVLQKQMIANNFINNEQIVLGYLVKKNPKYFACFHRHNYNYKHMAIFEELGK
jgi:hypothetical protein